jgi:eukaryotic-like serine/threonine-protein kinase
VREALLTARLQHPSIVPVYEAGRWPTGEPFYAMKLVSVRSCGRTTTRRGSV